MWPFSKRTKTGSCKEGAVCAWEFEGRLYKTKEERDRAEISYKKTKYRNDVIRFLERYTWVRRNHGDSYRSMVEIHCAPDYVTSIKNLTIPELADALIDNWGELHMHITELKRLGGN